MKRRRFRGSPQVSRRRFIGTVGSSLAGGMLLGNLSGCRNTDTPVGLRGRVVTRDPSLCHRVRDGAVPVYTGEIALEIIDVVIIGGGVSGLAAARRLLRSGVTNLLLVDNERELGGQSRAGELGGLPYPYAAHFVEAPHPRAAYLVALYRELGIVSAIDDRGWPVINPDHQLDAPLIKTRANGRWETDSFPSQIAQSADLAALKRFYGEMFAWANWRDELDRPAFGTPVALTSPDETVRSLDRISMADYLRQQQLSGSPLLRWYVDSRLINEYGTDSSQTSAWSGIHFWAATPRGFDELSPKEQRETVVLSWPEGNAFLARGMARELIPQQVALERLAVRVRNRPQWAEVTLLDTRTGGMRTVRARQVIYAAQKNMIYRVMPELASAGRFEFRSCRYVPWITAAVLVRRLPRAGGGPPAWDNIPYGRGWSLGYISGAHVAKRGADYRGPAILSFYGALYANMTAERRELLQGGFEHWAGLIAAELERMHPGIGRDIEQMELHKWAHPMIVPAPDHLWGTERQQMKQPLGRVHFANCDVGGLAVFEEAVYRGIAAAQEVIAALALPLGEDALAPGEWSNG